MQIDLSLNPTSELTKMTHGKEKKSTKRNLYTYQFLGQITDKKQRQNPKYTQYFYQLNITCQNFPRLQKIFAFKSKTKPTIWNALETNAYLGKKYLFYCRNYSGHYYLVDWEEKEVKNA